MFILYEGTLTIKSSNSKTSITIQMPWESITKFNYNLCLLYYVSSLVLSSWICDSLVSCHYVTLCVNVIIVRLESWVVWVYLRSPAILPVSYRHLIIKLYHYLHGEALLFLFSTYRVINNVLLAIEGKRFLWKINFNILSGAE